MLKHFPFDEYEYYKSNKIVDRLNIWNVTAAEQMSIKYGRGLLFLVTVKRISPNYTHLSLSHVQLVLNKINPKKSLQANQMVLHLNLSDSVKILLTCQLLIKWVYNELVLNYCMHVLEVYHKYCGRVGIWCWTLNSNGHMSMLVRTPPVLGLSLIFHVRKPTIDYLKL